MSGNLRLSDLLARSVAVEWYEAVALVGGVTDRLSERSGAPIVPELHQIEIAADGGVSVSGGVKTDEPVRRLGQLLQAVIVQSEPPVQLRLLIAQATAVTPAFGTIREYSSALEYFERPNRAGVLQSLYARAAAAPAPADFQQLPTIDAIVPLEDPEPWAASAKRSGRISNQAGVWLAVCAGLVLAAGTVAYLRFVDGSAKAKDVSAIALKASDAVGAAIVSGISSATERAGLGRLAPRGSTGTIPAGPPAAVETPAEPPKVRKAGAAPKPRIAKVEAFDLDPTPSAEEAVPVDTATVHPVPLAGAADPPEKIAKPDLTIYTPASAGVVPPVGIRPQLPRELPANIDKSQLGRIELVVLPNGTVGSVKLLDLPHNVHESMFLSAVKAWEFRPATKDGRPVSYRKVIWMAFQ